MDDNTLLFFESVTWGVWFPFRTDPILDALLESFLQNLSITDLQPLLDQVCSPNSAFDGHDMLELLRDVLRIGKHLLEDAMQVGSSGFDIKRKILAAFLAHIQIAL